MKRHINLLAYDVSKEYYDKLMKYCESNGIELKKCRKNDNLFNIDYSDAIDLGFAIGQTFNRIYFTIFTDTAGYEALCLAMPFEIVTCGTHDIFNELDCDDEFIEKFNELFDSVEEAYKHFVVINTRLHKFIMEIKNPNALKMISKIGYLTREQKDNINTRANVLIDKEKAQNAFIEEMVECANARECDVKKLRENTQMTRADFARYFGIPYRTVEDWENKKSYCATYLYDLMKKKLKYDGYIVD